MQLPVKNPYSHFNEFVKAVSGTNIPPGIFTGTVTAISSLVISDGEIPIDSDNLVVNASLTLAIGDEVAVMPSSDGQKYFVLCKVVSA